MPTGELPEDISELAEKAKAIAEATGRTEEDVLTDLLDDGKANMSAGQDIEKMDFLDKAQEQAEKFKKLLTTLIPVLALLLSIGAEGVGIMDITGWGSDSVWEDDDDPFGPPPIRWGCMNADALNYDETANEDDGTCEFEEKCFPEPSLLSQELLADGDALTLRIELENDAECEMEVEFRMELYLNDESEESWDYGVDYDAAWVSPSGSAFIDIQHGFMESVEDGEWYVEWSYLVVNNEHGAFESGTERTQTVTVDEIPDPCADDDEDGVCNEDEVGGCTDSSANNYDDQATDDDGSCVYDPETCEINLWDIEIDSNATHAWVVYDLDCGHEENDLDGYNVSVQFLIYHVNETNSGPNATGPLNWTTDLHFIEGWESDPHWLTLTEFAQNNTTHYDFYWYAIWEDADGEQQFIERKWLNRELNP